MGQGMSALQNILNWIQQSLAQSAEQLLALVNLYLGVFALLGLVVTLYQMAWGGRHLQAALGFCLRLLLVSTAVNLCPWLLGTLQAQSVSLGLAATGNRITMEQFLDPGALIRLGIESGGVLWQAYVNNSSWKLFPLVGTAYFLAWLVYVCAFAVMAYKVFWWQVEFLLMSLGSLVLLPSLLFRPTAFIASGALSYPANAFVRFFLGALLSGLLWNVLPTLTQIALPIGQVTLQAVDLKLQEAAYAVGLAWVLGCCFLAVNRTAGVLTSGVPAMAGGQSLGQFVQMVSGAGAGLLAAGGAATYGALGAGRGAVASVQGVRGAIEGARAISSTHTLGQAAREVYSGARAGVQGGAQAQLGHLMGRVSEATQTLQRQSVRQLMQGRGGDVSYRGVHH